MEKAKWTNLFINMALFFVLGSFSAVVAYVFHEAIKIREESEELKEESKYII